MIRVMMPISASDKEPSSCLSAALEAAGDVAYSWDLDLDRLEWSGRLSAGGFIWVHERGRAQRDSTGRPLRMLGVIRAIGDRKAEQSRLEQLANYDELTGHFNKSRLREAIDQIILANQRT